LLELGFVDPATATRYTTFAEQQLRALASPAYRALEPKKGRSKTTPYFGKCTLQKIISAIDG